MRRRLLRNLAERVFEEQLVGEGWQVMKRGMPDFACFRHGEFMLVEVKSPHSPWLKKEQYQLMSRLAQYGVPVFYWNSDEKKFIGVEAPPPTPLREEERRRE